MTGRFKKEKFWQMEQVLKMPILKEFCRFSADLSELRPISPLAQEVQIDARKFTITLNILYLCQK